MGRKFCNINIKGADAQYVQTIFPNLEVKSLADGWATVVGDELDYTSVRKTAVRISKAVDVPVLSVYYFDEDYAEFVLYRNGRRTARHIPAEYEGFERVRGKHTVWAEQLGIDADAVG
nr:hypothetical protein [Clostridia bacterium]